MLWMGVGGDVGCAMSAIRDFTFGACALTASTISFDTTEHAAADTFACKPLYQSLFQIV
jgi:hypothetical protein